MNSKESNFIFKIKKKKNQNKTGFDLKLFFSILYNSTNRHLPSFAVSKTSSGSHVAGFLIFSIRSKLLKTIFCKLSTYKSVHFNSKYVYTMKIRQLPAAVSDCDSTVSSVGLVSVLSHSWRSPDINAQNIKVPATKITKVIQKTTCHSCAVCNKRKKPPRLANRVQIKALSIQLLARREHIKHIMKRFMGADSRHM